MFGKDGKFKTFPDNFYNDANDFFTRAKKHNLKVILTMFSFECVNTKKCKKMITDADNQQAYIDNGLKPLLKYITDNDFKDQVHAIEMFNEPEWMIVGGSGVNQKIFNDESKGLARVQEFTTKCNKEIQNAGFKATVGSASLKWSCTTGHWCVGDWWANTNIDFRTVHYYSWMA